MGLGRWASACFADEFHSCLAVQASKPTIRKKDGLLGVTIMSIVTVFAKLFIKSHEPSNRVQGRQSRQALEANEELALPMEPAGCKQF